MVNWVNIGSGNGLLPVLYQAITWNNTDLSIGTSRNKLQWILNQNTKLFIQENAYEYVIYEMLAILSKGRWVNSL